MKKPLSVFHSASIPPVSIDDYSERLIKYCKIGEVPLELANKLFKRYLELEEIEQDSDEYKLIEHRLTLTCYIIASKYISNEIFSNPFWAKIAGISTKELMNLELQLLFKLDFKF